MKTVWLIQTVYDDDPLFDESFFRTKEEAEEAARNIYYKDDEFEAVEYVLAKALPAKAD